MLVLVTNREDVEAVLEKRLSTALCIPEQCDAETVKRIVREAHEELLPIINSGMFPIPGLKHREYHQKMWMQGHAAYKHYHDLAESPHTFFANPDKCEQECEGSPDCQRARFNVWYVKTHVIPNIGNIYDSIAKNWAISITSSARVKATHCLKAESLEDCDMELFKTRTKQL